MMTRTHLLAVAAFAVAFIVATVTAGVRSVDVPLSALNTSPADIQSSAPDAYGSAAAVVDLGLYAAPRSLDEIIQKADLIAVATVVRVISTHDLAPYDAGPSFRGPRLPVTDYEVRVDDPMRLPRGVTPEVSVVMRVVGRPDGASAPFPMPRVGERNLLFLSANPDQTYGLYFTVASRILIDGPTPSYSDASRRPVPFTSLGTSAFIELVRTSAR